MSSIKISSSFAFSQDEFYVASVAVCTYNNWQVKTIINHQTSTSFQVLLFTLGFDGYKAATPYLYMYQETNKQICIKIISFIGNIYGHCLCCKAFYTRAEAGSEECLGFSFFKNTLIQPLKSAETRTYPLLLVPLSLF